MVSDEWRDVVGFEGKYEISRNGIVRNKNSQKVLVQKNYLRKRNGNGSRNGLMVRLYIDKNRSMLKYVLCLMKQSFFGGGPKGKLAYHINGIITDNCIENIGFKTKSELGRMNGGPNRMTVARVNRSGEILEVYSSARDAAKSNYCSVKFVLNRCRRIVNDEYTGPDGYTFRFDI